jgi:P4 family phage/plasmid primase-like protien
MSDNISTPWIIEDLKHSGISQEDFPLPIIETQNGYKIRYADPVTGTAMLDSEGREYYREKLRMPVQNKEGKPAKYITAKNAGMRVYFPKGVHELLASASQEYIVGTEGEKKAICATIRGFPCIGFAGVWGWLESKDKRGDDKYMLHPDLTPYLNKDLLIIFDSDAVDEKKAMDFDYCAFRFAESLAKEGRTLYRVNLPADGDKKIGLDDYLLKHSVEELRAYVDTNRQTVDPDENPRAWWKAPEMSALVKKEGFPYSLDDDRISLNQAFFPGLFLVEEYVLFEPSENVFYVYEETSGLWKNVTGDSIKNKLSDSYGAFFGEVFKNSLGQLQSALNKRNDNFLSGITNLLKGKAEKRDVFSRSGKRFIHLPNGVLDLQEPEQIELKTFSPEWFSRNMIPIEFQQDAHCPRFLDELLRPQLDEDDILLLQKYCGNIILGGNPIQQLLILTGTAGGGKGTVTEIIEGITGRQNVAQLRTEHLSERFELSRFIGKTLLCGKDVAGNFLQQKSANVVKTLVGHDWLDAEIKGKTGSCTFRGEFTVVINCNSRLRVKLDGDTDADAWRRRLLIIEYQEAPVKKVIPDFSKFLIETEGAGILNWMVCGALLLLKDIQEFGKINQTAAQKERVDALLRESDGLRQFVMNGLERSSGNVTTGEIIDAYVDACNANKWKCIPVREIENLLPDIILSEFGEQKSTHIERNGRNQRGYENISLKRRVFSEN